ncbi:MAG: MerR family transcriptional regulator [Eubacterium sp.]|nr:MerR family transcriptional regulator [Eubacterium sp.]
MRQNGMKIKELEKEIGIPRANIRYYEKEGLLSPERGENGYREYSYEDLERLRRIVIFRKLGISLDDIKNLLDESTDLQSVLEKNIADLKSQIKQLNGSLEICSEMQSDKAEMSSFDTDRYWREITENEKKGYTFFSIVDDVWDDLADFYEFEKKHIGFNMISPLFKDMRGYVVFFLVVELAWIAISSVRYVTTGSLMEAAICTLVGLLSLALAIVYRIFWVRFVIKKLRPRIAAALYIIIAIALIVIPPIYIIRQLSFTINANEYGGYPLEDEIISVKCSDPEEYLSSLSVTEIAGTYKADTYEIYVSDGGSSFCFVKKDSTDPEWYYYGAGSAKVGNTVIFPTDEALFDEVVAIDSDGKIYEPLCVFDTSAGIISVFTFDVSDDREYDFSFYYNNGGEYIPADYTFYSKSLEEYNFTQLSQTDEGKFFMDYFDEWIEKTESAALSSDISTGTQILTKGYFGNHEYKIYPDAEGDYYYKDECSYMDYYVIKNGEDYILKEIYTSEDGGVKVNIFKAERDENLIKYFDEAVSAISDTP